LGYFYIAPNSKNSNPISGQDNPGLFILL